MANSSQSPRQKMINLLYLVFIGMLALNVSSEVLDGFKLVEESLVRTVSSSTTRNKLVFNDLEMYYKTNPEKTQKWYNLAKQVKIKSDSLFNYTEDLKLRIVRNADGEDGDPQNLKRADDLNAAFEVMFEPGKNDAKKLKNSINEYRTYVTSLVVDTTKKHIIENNLSTEPSRKAKKNKQTWEESMFFQMPVAAAITLLSKMQNDIRYAEGEVLNTLLNNIDVGDFRVNQIKAYVIPEAQTVMRGGTYSANIVLSAEDSTQRPKIFVNGRFLPLDAKGLFRVGVGSSGTFPVKGYIEMGRGDGSVRQLPFSSEYFVTEPSATVAPVWMNVLYAGIENEIRIAVPGTASQNVEAKISNGSLTRKGDLWSARPVLGSDAVISVFAKTSDGRMREVPKSIFRVRSLPDPLAFLESKDENGNPRKFKQGRLAKSRLSGIDELKASIDDGILNISFNVLRFDVVVTDNLGNSRRESSDGARFSQQQREMIRGTERGKFILISRISAKGPDGVTKDNIPPIEIIVN